MVKWDVWLLPLLERSRIGHPCHGEKKNIFMKKMKCWNMLKTISYFEYTHFYHFIFIYFVYFDVWRNILGYCTSLHSDLFMNSNDMHRYLWTPLHRLSEHGGLPRWPLSLSLLFIFFGCFFPLCLPLSLSLSLSLSFAPFPHTGGYF